VKLHALAGSALVAFGARLDLPALTRLEAEQDRAAALLRLARHQAIRAGAGIDAALALPLYLRDKVALTTAEREAVRGPRRLPHERAPVPEAQPPPRT
jgi:tRNA threonylcarbamoyladenosine biosynthesis protein TsaB